jgi:hypothetical protein
MRCCRGRYRRCRAYIAQRPPWDSRRAHSISPELQSAGPGPTAGSRSLLLFVALCSGSCSFLSFLSLLLLLFASCLLSQSSQSCPNPKLPQGCMQRCTRSCQLPGSARGMDLMFMCNLQLVSSNSPSDTPQHRGSEKEKKPPPIASSQ